MPTYTAKLALALIVILSTLGSPPCQNALDSDHEFGPVVRAYLGYLRNEQEVVDDRANVAR